MSYEYEHSVTYDFKKYKEKKQIEFSNERLIMLRPSQPDLQLT